MPEDRTRITSFLDQTKRLLGALDSDAVAAAVLHRESACSILVPVYSTPQTEAIRLVIEHLLMHLPKEDLHAG